MNEHDAIHLRQYRVESERLGNRRDVWLQPPHVGDTHEAGLAVFLDGEYYVTHFGAPRTMASLQERGTLPAMWTLYVGAGPQAMRWPESFCNDDFAAFVCDELVPQVEVHTGASGERLLVGVSLTGLSAAHLALGRPGTFTRVLCHSGSFWWERGKLSTEVPDAIPEHPTAFRLTVGSLETDTDVDHGNGLLQVDSQRAGVRQMRDALVARGYDVSYSEYEGGHDATSWRRELPDDLSALFGAEIACRSTRPPPRR